MVSKPKMPHNKQTLMMNQRIAEEARLLREERWIITALKKIKAQINGLQIERLHLESMRAKIIANPVNPSTNKCDDMLDALVNSVPLNRTDLDNANEGRLQSNIDDEYPCNYEDLNLAITKSVFTEPADMTEDEEIDEDDMENCVLDIDLIMNNNLCL